MDNRFFKMHLILLISIVLSCDNVENGNKTSTEQKLEKGTVKDVDNNIYQTIKIGEQWWMMENLKVKHFRNGNSISERTNLDSWATSNPAFTTYGDEAIYGLLYNFYAVINSNNLAPVGWHVATDEDWKKLERYVGLSDSSSNDSGLRRMAIYKMKDQNDDLWNESYVSKERYNQSGFSAKPAGSRWNDGSFRGQGGGTHFWTSTESENSSAWSRNMGLKENGMYRNTYYKEYGFSVRCVKN